jgi:hypothetical protein
MSLFLSAFDNFATIPSKSIVYIVYSDSQAVRLVLGPARACGEETAVIPFIEKTWPLWWVFALFVIVRWFHVVCDARTQAIDFPEPEEEEPVAERRHLLSA